MHVWEFLPEFTEELKLQLESDEKRWGDTWLQRTREGQEERIYARFDDYWLDYVEKKEPIPWLKVAGEALIAWIRENHPELWEKKEDILNK